MKSQKSLSFDFCRKYTILLLLPISTHFASGLLDVVLNDDNVGNTDRHSWKKHLSVLSAACQRISALDALSEQPDTIQSRPIIIGRRSIVHACSQIGIHANFLTYIIYANMCFYGAPQICLLLDQPH